MWGIKNSPILCTYIYIYLFLTQSVLPAVCCFFRVSKVHLTKSTLDCLNGDYEVEPGHGQERNSYLLKHNIDTYFIVPSHRHKVCTTPNVWICFICIQPNTDTWCTFHCYASFFPILREHVCGIALLVTKDLLVTSMV